jgi:hypothetical protein
MIRVYSLNSRPLTFAADTAATTAITDHRAFESHRADFLRLSSSIEERTEVRRRADVTL